MLGNIKYARLYSPEVEKFWDPQYMYTTFTCTGCKYYSGQKVLAVLCGRNNRHPNFSSHTSMKLERE